MGQKEDDKRKSPIRLQETNVNNPIDKSASANVRSASGLLEGSPSHANIVSDAEIIDQITLERDINEKIKAPIFASNRATRDNNTPLKLEPSARTDEDEFASSENKLGERQATVNDEDFDENPDRSVDEYISQYKFETSMDEGSLRSFLEISGSSPDQSEPSKGEPKSFSRRDGDTQDKGTIPREIEYDEPQLHERKNDSDDNTVTTAKCGSDNTAGTSDSYQTALDFLTDDGLPRDVANSLREPLAQEKHHETKVDHFETSIDEGSLRSFLELSISSPEQTEASEDGTRSVSRMDRNADAKSASPNVIVSVTPQLQQRAGDSDNESTTTVKCASGSTGDSYQTVLETLTHNELSREILTSMEKPLSHEKSNETKGEAEPQPFGDKESLCPTAGSNTINLDDIGASGLPKKQESNERNISAQNSEALTAQSLHNMSANDDHTRSASGPKETDQASSPELLVDSHKNRKDVTQERNEATNSSEQASRKDSRTRTASNTEIKTRHAGSKDSIGQNHRHSSRTKSSSGHRTNETRSEGRSTNKAPKPSTRRISKSAPVRGNKEKEEIASEKKSSLAKNAAKSGKRRAENERRRGHSNFRNVISAGQAKREHRGVLKPKRRGELNKRPIPKAKQHKRQKHHVPRGDRRHKSSGKGLMAPITFSAKDGICFNEKALIQLHETIFSEVSDVVSALEHEVQKGSQKQRGKIGFGVVMLKKEK